MQVIEPQLRAGRADIVDASCERFGDTVEPMARWYRAFLAVLFNVSSDGHGYLKLVRVRVGRLCFP